MLTNTVIVLAQALVASAAVAKRQEGPLVYSQGEMDQGGAVSGSSEHFDVPLGCYPDNYPYSRLLNGTFFSEPTYVTPETCSQYCSERGYLYSGTEYYSQCFCGNGLGNAQPLDPSTCDTPCSASTSETCGGSNALSIVRVNQVYTSGCFADDVNYRSLTGAFYDSPDMTIEKCTSLCAGNGNSLAGLEYGSQCFCGDALRLGPSNNCNMPCAGNAAETCGGGNALSVYQVAGQPITSASASTSNFGCFTDYYPNSRALNGPSITTGDNTNESCQQFCTGQGYPYSGTEFGTECYCGMTAPTAASTGCTQACSGNANEICGGSNALSVTYYGAAQPAVSGPPYSNSTSSTATMKRSAK